MTHDKKQPEIFQKIYATANRLSVLFIFLIFIIELGIMILLSFLPPLTGITMAFFDSILLVLLLLPAMYFLVFKPVVKNINKFQNSQNTFRQAKDLPERIISNANVIVIGINEAGEINLFNETAEKISGYTLQELQGRSWFKKLVPTGKYPEMWKDYISIAEIGQTPKTFENAILTKSGEERYISWQNELMRDGNRTTGIISYGIDITERKKAEDKLKESEKKYNDLFQKSEDGNMIIIDGNIIECNNAFLRMLGYTLKDRIIDKHPSELSPEFQPDGKPSNEKANEMMNLALEEGSHRFEWMHKKADGEVFPVEVLLTVIDRDKKIIHTTLRDITTRKQAEKELYESEERYRSIFQNSSIGIYRTTPKGKILLANPTLIKMLGYKSLEELQLRNLENNFYGPENRRPEFLNRIESDGEVKAFESAWKRKDNTIIYIRESARVFRDEEGRVLFYEGMVEDISELKRFELERSIRSEIELSLTTATDLQELLKLIHDSLGKVLYAENCFFAFYDPKTKLFNFPYFVDKYDQAPVPSALEKSCTAYVFRAGKSMLIDKDMFEELRLQNEVELVGSNSPSWIGIPLQTSDRIIGILVLQHYEVEYIYTEEHLRFLNSIGGQVANIIERKRAEEDLARSFSLLNATLESTADGILVVDKNGKISNFNKKFIKLWRIPKPIISTRDDAKIMSFVLDQLIDPVGFVKKVDALYLNDEEISFDILEFNDGRTFERYSQAQRFEGRSEGRVWSFHDITNIVSAQRELRESEEKFRTFFEKSPIGIEIYNALGIQVDANPASLVMFGIKDKSNVLGFNLFEGTSLSEDLKTKLQHGTTIEYTAVFNFDKIRKLNQYQTNNSGEAEMLYSITPMKSTEGENILGYLLLVQNITERKQAEKALKESETRLHELNATKDKFFSIIAHDLKSPFNSIEGFSAHLVQQVQEKDYEGIEEYAAIIQTSSKRAMNLLSNLMEWSLSQTGRIAFNPAYIEIVSLINEVTELLADAAVQKSITIKKELPLNTFVFADKAMISTVFRNLISNAIKFTNPGGNIVVSVELKKHEMIAAVSDSGIGIKKASIEKLFRIDESYSTAGTQNEKGTGLGLILCKEFVEKHGGKIRVESEMGKGTVFYFTIPVN